jgi:hypothetical protein
MPWDPITKESAFWPHSESETARFAEAPRDAAEIDEVARLMAGIVFAAGESGLSRARRQRSQGWVIGYVRPPSAGTTLESRDYAELARVTSPVGERSDLKAVRVTRRVMGEGRERIWEDAG